MRQAVIRLPNLTGFGKYPDLTPSSHADLLIGNSFKNHLDSLENSSKDDLI